MLMIHVDVLHAGQEAKLVLCDNVIYGQGVDRRYPLVAQFGKHEPSKRQRSNYCVKSAASAIRLSTMYIQSFPGGIRPIIRGPRSQGAKPSNTYIVHY